jgi:hypothetical protein
MLCLPAEFFWVVKFCYWATTEKWAWQGKKKLLKVVLKFAISRHLFLTCCHHSHPEKEIFFQTNFCTNFYKNFTKFPILQTNKPISSFQSVQIRSLCIVFVCGVFFPFPAKLTNLGSYWTYQGLQQLLHKKAKVTADCSFNTSSHHLCMSLLLAIDIYISIAHCR